MTELVPAPLVSRQAVARSTPAPAPAMSLSEVERVCNMIATGGDLVPKCYHGKPGAVYLALAWARKHNVDEMTAIQNIVPINGKPFVQAELRREVMEGKGYRVDVLTSTSTRCEIEITGPDGRTRRVVAALPDAPEEEGEGLLFVQPGEEFRKNALWTSRRPDMLYALAIRIGDRRIVGSAAAGIDSAQDYEQQPDPLTVLASTPGLASTPEELINQELADGFAEAADSWDEPTPAVADALGDQVTEADLLGAAETAGIKPARVKLLKHAQTQLGWRGGTIEDIVADQDVAHRLLAAIGAGEL